MGSKRLENIPAKFRKNVRNELDELAATIKETRNIKGFTQEELASHVNLAITTIQAIENGRRFPSLPTLLYICSSLGIEVGFKRPKK